MKRLDPGQLEAIARRLEAGEPVPPRELRAVCAMALELLHAAPSQEMVRLAAMLVSSRGALPLKPAQAEALGAAVLQAARASLIDRVHAALRDAHAALSQGRNWIEGLERVPPGSQFGRQIPGLARSMTKAMRRCLASTAETFHFGMAVQLEPLDPAEPGFKDVPPFERIEPRQRTDELERAREALRVSRLGVLKVARFTHALSSSPAKRAWDDALAQLAARGALDAAAHLAALEQFLAAQDGLPSGDAKPGTG